MKKSILWISLLSISVISCQKSGRDDMNTQSTVIVEKQVDAKLVNGHLAFNAESDYEKFLTISPDEKKSLIEDWARGNTFISLKDGKLRGANRS